MQKIHQVQKTHRGSWNTYCAHLTWICTHTVHAWLEFVEKWKPVYKYAQLHLIVYFVRTLEKYVQTCIYKYFVQDQGQRDALPRMDSARYALFCTVWLLTLVFCVKMSSLCTFRLPVTGQGLNSLVRILICRESARTTIRVPRPKLRCQALLVGHYTNAGDAPSPLDCARWPSCHWVIADLIMILWHGFLKTWNHVSQVLRIDVSRSCETRRSFCLWLKVF